MSHHDKPSPLVSIGRSNNCNVRGALGVGTWELLLESRWEFQATNAPPTPWAVAGEERVHILVFLEWMLDLTPSLLLLLC